MQEEMAHGNKKVSEPQKIFTFQSQIFHHVVFYVKGGSEYTVTLYSNFCSVGKGKRVGIDFWLLAILHWNSESSSMFSQEITCNEFRVFYFMKKRLECVLTVSRNFP